MKTREFEDIKTRFARHFPSAPPTSDLMYADGDNWHICGTIQNETDDSLELLFRGTHEKIEIEYSIGLALSSDAVDPTPLITLSCTKPSAYAVEILAGGREFNIKETLSPRIGAKEVICLGLAGGKAAVECWYSCRRNVQCWKDCLKGKGAAFGFDIAACIALTD